MKVCLMMMTKSFLRPSAAVVDREGGAGAARRFEDVDRGWTR
jgi:hypothetical protein